VKETLAVEASAPVRIDLAGGTLDLEGIYAFLGGAVTVNVAVELRAWAQARPIKPGWIRLAAQDLKAQAEGPSLDRLRLPRSLLLHARALEHFGPRSGVELTTRARAPAGSGLGGSSALLVAISAALHRLQGRRLSKSLLVETSCRLEASILKVPTGRQDYLAALFGGLRAYHFGFEGWQAERLSVSPKFLQALEDRLLLAYTGASRLSGAPNWEKFKAYVEDRGSTRRRFERLKAIALEMRQALLAEDLDWAGSLMAQECSIRRRLLPGLYPARVDEALRRARRLGALGGKLCGAGGGGCLAVLVAQDARDRVEACLKAAGFRLLAWRVARRGLLVSPKKET
jgi:D-glycero-alpha-D-manno-heptose-7-phosphate kinase